MPLSKPSSRSLLTAAAATASLIAGCSTFSQTPSPGHLRAESAPAQDTASIPQPVQSAVALPKPKAAAKTETYSVVVNNVKAQELLFALARDAKLNVDIHPGIGGTVTLNAIDQTLPQLLTRISKQVDMRWELDGPNLIVMPDTPFLRTYRVDYLNMSRDASGSVSISTQIGSTTSSVDAKGGGGAGGSNVSSSKVENIAKNHFWESLEKNVKDILRETDKILPEGSSETVVERSDQQSTTASTSTGRSNNAKTQGPGETQQEGTTVIRRATFREAASVIVNPEAGVVAVRASSRQHEKVQEFLDRVMSSAKRQVLIEMTIAEVTLNNEYQQGINWQSLRKNRTGTHTAGFSLSQGGATGGIPAADGKSFVLDYVAPALGISSTISLLETFGNVRVLSSPKLSVINNQTALLKVVNNVVYFDIQSNTTASNTSTQTTVTTTPHSVSVGLVMTVTPQISEEGNVLINVRPSVSRVKGFKNDPNPNIPAGLSNQVPEIETREMESLLRLADGEIAVMGGLMQDSVDNTTDAVPIVSQIPLLGNLFKQRSETATKTELVIFLRPAVIRDPSVNGDYRDFRAQLPASSFLNDGQKAQGGRP
ncbi:MAG TPA: pilus (MSHA type) biogenesis protein MshL [Rhodocyclaceae bacterium]